MASGGKTKQEELRYVCLFSIQLNIADLDITDHGAVVNEKSRTTAPPPLGPEAIAFHSAYVWPGYKL